MQVIEINGVEFIVGTAVELADRRGITTIRQLQGDLCYSPMSGTITNGAVFQAAGVNMNKIDFSTPQDWFNEWNELIQARGGAVWSYEDDSLAGFPIFQDEAWCRIEALITLRVRPDSFIEPSYAEGVDDAD